MGRSRNMNVSHRTWEVPVTEAVDVASAAPVKETLRDGPPACGPSAKNTNKESRPRRKLRRGLGSEPGSGGACAFSPEEVCSSRLPFLAKCRAFSKFLGLKKDQRSPILRARCRAREKDWGARMDLLASTASMEGWGFRLGNASYALSRCFQTLLGATSGMMEGGVSYRDVASVSHDAIPPLVMVPPPNFAMVDKGVYRSGFPNNRNFDFLKTLRLRSVV
eukprot:jgi/Bigna1/71246/fgenesh1_pg.15_\